MSSHDPDDYLPDHWRFETESERPVSAPETSGPSFMTQALPPEADRRICSVCHKALGDTQVEICWTPRSSFHVRCHDWRDERFPVQIVEDLRILYRGMGALRPEIAKTGAALAALQAQWPRGGADSVVQARKLRNELREVIDQLQIMRRLYNIQG
jgi:hypothetical protein